MLSVQIIENDNGTFYLAVDSLSREVILELVETTPKVDGMLIKQNDLICKVREFWEKLEQS